MVPSSARNVAQPFCSHLDGLLLERIVWHMPGHAVTDRLSACSAPPVGWWLLFLLPASAVISITPRSVPQEAELFRRTFQQLFSSSERFSSVKISILKDVLLSFSWKEENTPCAPHTFSIFLRYMTAVSSHATELELLGSFWCKYRGMGTMELPQNKELLM